MRWEREAEQLLSPNLDRGEKMLSELCVKAERKVTWWFLSNVSFGRHIVGPATARLRGK
jgi:hypothetical protein